MITVAKKLTLNDIHTIKSVKASKSNDGRFLIITGVAEDKDPARVMAFIGNDVAQDIAFGAILGQLGLYGEYKTAGDCIKAINGKKNAELKVKLVQETYTDPATLQEKMGIRTYFDVDQF